MKLTKGKKTITVHSEPQAAPFLRAGWVKAEADKEQDKKEPAK